MFFEISCSIIGSHEQMCVLATQLSSFNLNKVTSLIFRIGLFVKWNRFEFVSLSTGPRLFQNLEMLWSFSLFPQFHASNQICDIWNKKQTNLTRRKYLYCIIHWLNALIITKPSTNSIQNKDNINKALLLLAWRVV